MTIFSFIVRDMVIRQHLKQSKLLWLWAQQHDIAIICSLYLPHQRNILRQSRRSRFLYILYPYSDYDDMTITICGP